MINKGKILYTHLVIFILQLAFAFFSVGNAEFMIMLPFLAAIIVSQIGCLLSQKAATALVLSMLVWNFAAGILPAVLFDYSGVNGLSKIVSERNNDLFILRNHWNLECQINYESGKYPANVTGTPEYFARRDTGLSHLSELIGRMHEKGLNVYTDCLDNPEGFSRASFLEGNQDKEFFKTYSLEQGLFYENFYGRQKLLKVLPHNQHK